MKLPRIFGLGWLAGSISFSAWGAVPDAAVAALRAVGPEGQGNEAAQKAWPTVAAAPVQSVPVLLVAMDGANDYALNWLRAAVEAIVQREAAAGRKVPVAELETYLSQTQHHPKARRLAYDLIVQAAPERAQALVPGFLNDPSNELRRDAVERLMTQATNQIAGNKTAAVATYQQALGAAREADQIEAIAKTLGDLGQKVDLAQTFGWVTRWKMVGPFDNTDNVGFVKAYPPEETLDFTAEYDGKKGKVKWVEQEFRNDYGLVDFNKPFEPLKEVAGYATAEFWSDQARPAEVRLGCKNGWKVWFNGKYLFGRDEYHTGAEIDQFRLPVELKAGKNVILVKCTQNEQTEDWTKEWEFQLRVTDAQGTPIVSTR